MAGINPIESIPQEPASEKGDLDAGRTGSGAPPPSLEPTAIADRTVPGIFYRQAARLSGRPLLHHHDGEGWRATTWGRMRELTLNLATHLVRLGVGAGDAVVVMSENRVEWIFCDLAIQSVGAVTVPIYPSTTAPVTQGIVADCEAHLAIAGTDAIAARLAPEPGLTRVALMDAEIRDWGRAAAGVAELEEVHRRLRALGPDDLATLVYTSGTTGEPKGVMLPHRCFADMAVSTLKAFDVGEDDVSLSFLPYSHILERMDGIVVGMAAGTSAYLSRGLTHLAEDLQVARPTTMVGVPRIYEKIYDHVHDQVHRQGAVKRAVFRWAVETGRRAAGSGRPAGALAIQHAIARRLVLRELHRRITGGRLRFFVSGGAPLAREVESFFWAIGTPILQGWGLTETTSGATSNTERDHRFETVGKPFSGVEVKLDGDGEIMVRGPGVMSGYHNRAEASAEALEGGWLRTGDIGKLDREGFLTITDRKKDLIKTAGGKYVAPQPIEARLEDHRIVQRAVLIGDQRPYITALIVPDWEGLTTRQGIKGEPGRLVADGRVRRLIQDHVDAVNRGLSGFETVKQFRLLATDLSEAEGDLTPTLKVKRRAIAARHRELIEAMYQAGSPPPAGTAAPSQARR